jgi:hypothetical protein
LVACDLTDEALELESVAAIGLPTVTAGKIASCQDAEIQMTREEVASAWDSLATMFDGVARGASTVQYRVNDETRNLQTAEFATELGRGLRPTGAGVLKIKCFPGRVSVGIELGGAFDDGGTLYGFGLIEGGTTVTPPDGRTIVVSEATVFMAKVKKQGLGLSAQWVKAGDPRN